MFTRILVFTQSVLIVFVLSCTHEHSKIQNKSRSVSGLKNCKSLVYTVYYNPDDFDGDGIEELHPDVSEIPDVWSSSTEWQTFLIDQKALQRQIKTNSTKDVVIQLTLANHNGKTLWSKGYRSWTLPRTKKEAPFAKLDKFDAINSLKPRIYVPNERKKEKIPEAMIIQLMYKTKILCTNRLEIDSH